MWKVSRKEKLEEDKREQKRWQEEEESDKKSGRKTKNVRKVEDSSKKEKAKLKSNMWKNWREEDYEEKKVTNPVDEEVLEEGLIVHAHQSNNKILSFTGGKIPGLRKPGGKEADSNIGEGRQLACEEGDCCQNWGWVRKVESLSLVERLAQASRKIPRRTTRAKEGPSPLKITQKTKNSPASLSFRLFPTERNMSAWRGRKVQQIERLLNVNLNWLTPLQDLNLCHPNLEVRNATGLNQICRV